MTSTKDNTKAAGAVGAEVVKAGATGQPASVPAAARPGTAQSPGTPQVKKPLGAKEIIPFAWKLVGVGHGYALTLFKSIEREDAEAQSERVRRDGYYTDLRILDIDAKVKQPKGAKADNVVPPKKTAKKATKKTEVAPTKPKRRIAITVVLPTKTTAKKKAATAKTKTAKKKTVTGKAGTGKAAAKKTVKKAATKTTKKTAATKKATPQKTAAKATKKKTTKKAAATKKAAKKSGKR